MATTLTLTRFDLRVPSERTGRLVLPALRNLRACACCEMLVATGWVLPSGDSVCADCEATIARASEFHGSLDAFAAHVHRIGASTIHPRVFVKLWRKWGRGTRATRSRVLSRLCRSVRAFARHGFVSIS